MGIRMEELLIDYSEKLSSMPTLHYLIKKIIQNAQFFDRMLFRISGFHKLRENMKNFNLLLVPLNLGSNPVFSIGSIIS